jgi:L,D-peptidoglycan transpeptidase YkuD (ErfK/YbiS/YcfS/YnhG family)
MYNADAGQFCRMVTWDKNGKVHIHAEDGSCKDPNYDLFFATKKRKVWIYIEKKPFYNNNNEAKFTTSVATTSKEALRKDHNYDNTEVYDLVEVEIEEN